MASRYVNGTMKHDGVCLLPPPSHHYRMVPSQTPRENFLANQNYVQQAPNQASTQGVGLRGIAQTGPPNQAPTPPNQDLKIQTVPQQAPMTIYQQQNTVGSRPQFFNRPPGPPTQNTRMAGNPHRIYQNTPHQYLPQNIFINSMGYYNSPQQRQNFVQPQVTLIQSQHYPTYQAFTPTQIPQTPQTAVAYQYYQMVRPGPPPQPVSTPSNPNQVPIASSIPIQQPVIPQQTMTRQQKQRRPNAIAIINPDTEDHDGTNQNPRRPNPISVIDPIVFSSNTDYNGGTNRIQRIPNQISIVNPVNDEFSSKGDDYSSIQNHRRGYDMNTLGSNAFSSKGDYNSTYKKRRRPNAISIIDPTTGRDMLEQMFEQDNSHPPSGESSARQTPQPAPHIPNKEVQAPFAKPMTYMTNEADMMEYDGVPSPTQAPEGTEEFHDIYTMMPVAPQPPPPVSRSNPKYDHIAQTSTLKAHAKEFVLPSAKEPPVVSANCDSVEVTLNKLQKGRESPSKGRKAKDHHKEAIKDAAHAVKETAHQPEKQQIPVVKEEPETAAIPPPKPKEIAPPNNNQHSSKVPEKENDKRKKDNKSDNKQATENNANDNAKQANQNQEHETSHPTSKSKQNSNQKKDNHKTNNQRPNPPNVPTPQPAKSNSKTIKKNELNSKGASKEGNDMDVFQISDAVNANVPITATATAPATNNSDVINANVPAVAANNATPAIAEPQKTVVNEVAAVKAETNNVAAPVKPEAKPAQKVWDVTNVFWGRLPEPSPYVPSSTENNQDETDRAVVAKDRPAQNAAGEAAAQVPAQAAEKKPELPYKDGQWAPFNLEGNKKYDRDFLLAVRNLPIARVKPANLPESVEYSEGSRQRSSDNRDMRFSNMMGKDFTTPPFMPFGGKNSSMKGSSITKHPSLSGEMGNKGGKSVNGGNKISISLREDIKLHETENAWKPGRLAKAENKSEEDRKTEELYKKVRGVLNKLTPQKFDTLLSQIKALKVDTVERLQGVINLVFEKAIDEPNFAVAYAKMCMELALMQVTRKTEDGKEESLNFRKLLITRCQEEFEKQSADEGNVLSKIVAIGEASGDAQKTEATEELEEYLRKLRRRSVGNVRFIGELFKINMLTSNIMTVCINVLLQHGDEESLECLCRLLTTIGSKLEETKDLSPYFAHMQAIVDKKNNKDAKDSKDNKEKEAKNKEAKDAKDSKDSKDTKDKEGKDNKEKEGKDAKEKEGKDAKDKDGKDTKDKDGKDNKPKEEKEPKEKEIIVSSRIRFMLQDVIDLRKNKWVPRRQDAGPKTIDQIARDVATEQLNSQLLNSVPSTPRRDDRDMGGRGRMRNNQDEWHNHNHPKTNTFNFNKDKLKMNVPSADETLGQSAMFKMWNKGAAMKPPPPQSQAQTVTSNRFSLLDNSNFLENDKKMSGGNGGGRYKDNSYHSKGSSLERSSYGRQNYDKRGGSRSGSQHRINDGAGPSGMNLSGPSSSMTRAAAPPPAVVKPPTPPPLTVTKMTEDQMKRFCKNCFDEYINDNCTFEECDQDIGANIPTSYIGVMVADAILDILETSKTKRTKLGLLLGKLLAVGTVPSTEMGTALEDIFSQVEDLIIDIPTIWTCLAEILVPIMVEGGLKLTALHKYCKVLIQNGMGDKILLAIFKNVIIEKGPNYLKELWQASNLKLTDFMSEDLAANFIENNKLEFLTGGAPAQGNSELNCDQIERKLLEFFEANTPFDDICMWITANVGQRVQEISFIRTLATAIYKYSIVRTKLNNERLSRLSKLFNKYVDNNSTYELQCLYALQSLVNHLEHPQGLLLSIFNKLSEDSIFAQESFLSWENSKDPAEQEGKGVALKQLTAFFTQLKENDDDDYVSTGSDEA